MNNCPSGSISGFLEQQIALAMLKETRDKDGILHVSRMGVVDKSVTEKRDSSNARVAGVLKK